MAKTPRLVVDAQSGFMPFDLTELHDLWSNLQDGNYYTAFKRAIRILDNVLNAENGRTQARVWTPETGESVNDCCDQMEQWCERAKADTGRLMAERPRNVGDEQTQVDPFTIIMIVETVLKFIQGWRKRRNPQRTGRVETRINTPPGDFNENPRKDVNNVATNKPNDSNKPTQQGAVNRPAGVTNDQPAPAVTDPRESGGEGKPVTNDTNTKEDTLAGKQTPIPPDESAANELDAKKQAERKESGEDDTDDGEDEEPNKPVTGAIGDAQGNPKDSDVMRKMKEQQAKHQPPQQQPPKKPPGSRR